MVGPRRRTSSQGRASAVARGWGCAYSLWESARFQSVRRCCYRRARSPAASSGDRRFTERPRCACVRTAKPVASPVPSLIRLASLNAHRRAFVARVAAVLPGLGIQVAQNQLDQRFDEEGISRFDTSYGVAICRVVTGHVLQLLALLVFLAGLHDEDSPVLHRPHAALRTWNDEQSLRMYCNFVVIGTGCAIVYGTYAQTVSMFPERYHAFFFIGTYSVSWAIAPFNLLIGSLCPVADGHSIETAGGEHGTCVLGDSCPQWTRIAAFYAIGGMFNVGGLVAFVMLTCTELGKQVYDLKDEVLVPTSSGRRRKPGLRSSSRHGSQSQQVSGAGASNIQFGDTVVIDPPESSFSTGCLPTANDVDTPTIYATSSSSSSTGENHDGTAASRDVWCTTLGCGLVMMLALCENLLICGQYSDLKSQGQILLKMKI